MPFGMLPVLEIDGQMVAQSNAVARYLARQYGLAGKDEWESLQCDVLVDTLGDLKQGKRRRNRLFFLSNINNYTEPIWKIIAFLFTVTGNDVKKMLFIHSTHLHECLLILVSRCLNARTFVHD